MVARSKSKSYGIHLSRAIAAMLVAGLSAALIGCPGGGVGTSIATLGISNAVVAVNGNVSGDSGGFADVQSGRRSIFDDGLMSPAYAQTLGGTVIIDNTGTQVSGATLNR